MERLLNRRTTRGVTRYLVRWRGHASSDDEWPGLRVEDARRRWRSMTPPPHAAAPLAGLPRTRPLLRPPEQWGCLRPVWRRPAAGGSGSPCGPVDAAPPGPPRPRLAGLPAAAPTPGVALAGRPSWASGPGGAGRTNRELSQRNQRTRLMHLAQPSLTTLIMDFPIRFINQPRC